MLRPIPRTLCCGRRLDLWPDAGANAPAGAGFAMLRPARAIAVSERKFCHDRVQSGHRAFAAGIRRAFAVRKSSRSAKGGRTLSLYALQVQLAGTQEGASYQSSHAPRVGKAAACNRLSPLRAPEFSISVFGPLCLG